MIDVYKRQFVNHDRKGLEFDHYPDHQKITLKWAQVEKYIDLMIQSDRYLTDKEKEHNTPPVPITLSLIHIWSLKTAPVSSTIR